MLFSKSVGLLQHLIKTPSFSGEETVAADLVEDYLASYSIKTKRQARPNIPSVKIGPGDSARSHTADEYIFLEEIKRGINLYIKLLDMLPLMLINNPTQYKNEIKYINN
jgi:acetylornithine deacetylase/succinyl-diaminopimelate desuccinylase-like protein